MNFFRTKFNKKFFAGLLVVLVVLAFRHVSLASAYTSAQIKAQQQHYISGGSRGGEITNGRPISSKAAAEAAAKKIAEEQKKAKGFSVKLLDLADKFLTWTVSADLYEKVFFSPAARTGVMNAWKVVRGFVNMFYLLLLIFLAISTILQINKFSDKKLFLKVIFSAILVNFSLPITLFVIDASNMFMVYFASAIDTTSVATKLFGDAHYASTGFDLNALVLKAATSTMQFIVNIITAVMLLYTGVALLIRLIAYWVLIILSPLAFFSLAIPGGSGFNEWKDKLVAYSVFGPVMLFFIWLALSLVSALRDAFVKSGVNGTDEWVLFLTAYITGLYILYYGHDKAKSWGAKAGDAVGKVLDKGGQYAVKAGKFTATGGPVGMFAKSTAEAQYTGMKARLNEGKWTRLVTKEGRKESQEEKNFDAKIKYATIDKKQALEMQRAEKTLSTWKEAGKDIENEDVLVDKLRNGNKIEKQAAALQLSKLGKLKIDATGNRYTEAKNAVVGNKFLDKAVERGAGAKNKVAIYKHHLDNIASGSPSTESIKFVNSKIDTAMEEANANGASYTIGSAADRTVFVAQRRLDYERSIGRTATMDEGREQAVLTGIFSETKSNMDLANMANEQKGSVGRDVTEHMAAYLKSATGTGRYSNRGKEIIADNLKGEQRAIFRNRRVV